MVFVHKSCVTIVIQIRNRKDTLPETNIAPENGWLEAYFPIFRGYVNFGRVISSNMHICTCFTAGQFELNTAGLQTVKGFLVFQGCNPLPFPVVGIPSRK